MNCPTSTFLVTTTALKGALSEVRSRLSCARARLASAASRASRVASSWGLRRARGASAGSRPSPSISHSFWAVICRASSQLQVHPGLLDAGLLGLDGQGVVPSVDLGDERALLERPPGMRSSLTRVMRPATWEVTATDCAACTVPLAWTTTAASWAATVVMPTSCATSSGGFWSADPLVATNTPAQATPARVMNNGSTKRVRNFIGGSEGCRRSSQGLHPRAAEGVVELDAGLESGALGLHMAQLRGL